MVAEDARFACDCACTASRTCAPRGAKPELAKEAAFDALPGVCPNAHAQPPARIANAAIRIFMVFIFLPDFSR